MNKMDQNLSNKSVAGLARAYMYLYKKLVSAYQSNGDSVGQSQFNAICVMRTILMAHHNTESKDPAIKFLFKLYNTHRGIVAKKTMISPDKDDVVPVPKNSALTVALAVSTLENVILSTLPQTLSALYRIPTGSILPDVKEHGKPKRNFYNCLGNTANPADIQKLQTDPRYLGELYNRYVKHNRYVKRQAHR